MYINTIHILIIAICNLSLPTLILLKIEIVIWYQATLEKITHSAEFMQDQI
jgi:hypothetical protein